MTLYRIVAEDHIQLHFYVEAETPGEAECEIYELGHSDASKSYSNGYDILSIEEVNEDEYL